MSIYLINCLSIKGMRLLWPLLSQILLLWVLLWCRQRHPRAAGSVSLSPVCSTWWLHSDDISRLLPYPGYATGASLKVSVTLLKLEGGVRPEGNRHSVVSSGGKWVWFFNFFDIVYWWCFLCVDSRGDQDQTVYSIWHWDQHKPLYIF